MKREAPEIEREGGRGERERGGRGRERERGRDQFIMCFMWDE